MIQRWQHGPTPHCSILRLWQKHGAESISGLTRPLRVKCWCKIFPTYLTLSSEFYTIIIWSQWSITLLFYEVQYCSKASNVSALEYILDKVILYNPLSLRLLALCICVGMLTMPRSPNVQILNRKRRDWSHNGHHRHGETFWGTQEFQSIHSTHKPFLWVTLLLWNPLV